MAPNVSCMSEPRHRPAVPVAGAAAALLATLWIALGGCGGGADATTPTGDSGDRFDGDRAFADVRAQVALGPRPSGSRAAVTLSRSLARELRAAGVDDVRIQAPLRNVVGTIPGREDGFVVLGAHYDTKPGIPGFVGANDGASGTAVVLELARALPRTMPGPGVAIALFDGEEARPGREFSADGTRGSRRYLDLAAAGRQGSPPLSAIRAMVLLDMVGDCDLAIPREESSDEDLYRLFADADPDVFSDTAGGVEDDHTPFQVAGIPAVDLIDFEYGPGPSPGEWWHTPEDDLDKVCPTAVDAVGGAALQALPQIR